MASLLAATGVGLQALLSTVCVDVNWRLAAPEVEPAQALTKDVCAPSWEGRSRNLN